MMIRNLEEKIIILDWVIMTLNNNNGFFLLA
jgi:hypothetical protein